MYNTSQMSVTIQIRALLIIKQHFNSDSKLISLYHRIISKYKQPSFATVLQCALLYYIFYIYIYKNVTLFVGRLLMMAYLGK
jgi:hypothetical protein